MVRGEEKQFERLETEGDRMGWSEVLDTFTSICGQMNLLMRFIRDKTKSKSIENRVVLPLLLSLDRDEELARLTEGRVQLVNHEMVPDYLRTKPDPEVEEAEKVIQTKSNAIGPDVAIKQIAIMDKFVRNICETINRARPDKEMAKQETKKFFNNNDTSELIMAISDGKGLRMGLSMNRGVQMIPGDPSMSQKPHDQMSQHQKQNVKAPELKTNIKAGP